MNTYLSIALLFLLAAVAACSGAANAPVATDNRTAVFEPGAPNFDMEAIAVLENGSTGLDVYAAIPSASLVYLKRGDEFEARYELLIRATPRGTRSATFEQVLTDTLVTASYDSTQSIERHHRRAHIPLPPGSYVVEATLEDAESEMRASRSQEVEISNASSGEVLLSDIRLEVSRHGRSFEPALSLHLATGYDSLRALTELYNLPESAEATMTLVRFSSDTSVAAPPFMFTPGPFTMPYIGVEYDAGDTIQVSRRVLAEPSDHISIEFSLPMLERGNYLAELNVTGEDLAHESRRHFVVMREGFPMIEAMDEMVEAVRYISGEDDWSKMMNADSLAEKKNLFDEFWAGIVPNKEAAASLLESYYSRVEEANLLFSNHKEGWKTDRGMIYVIFGPPPYTESHYQRRDWYYFEEGFPLSRRLPPFIFKRSTAYGLGGLFENYILQRAPEYEHEWRLRIAKWRDGVSM